MNAFESLMSNRWIVRDEDKERYYKVKDGLPAFRKFIAEKLGAAILINPQLIKIEKIPDDPEPWMGISDFGTTLEYEYFCYLLLYLEEMEKEEQFILSQLTDFLQTQMEVAKADWTLYACRRQFIRVLKFAAEQGLILVNDGDQEGFASDENREVLYENTGRSRYFACMGIETMEASQQEGPRSTDGLSDLRESNEEEQGSWDPLWEKSPWEEEEGMQREDAADQRGVARRQRVYRKLLYRLGVQREQGEDPDFDYIKNYANSIRRDLALLTQAQLHIHKNSAFLVMGENSKLGAPFPENQNACDIALLLCQKIQERQKNGLHQADLYERVELSQVDFAEMVEEIKGQYEAYFSKGFREKTMTDLTREILEYMKGKELLRWDLERRRLVALPLCGKIAGFFPQVESKTKEQEKEEIQ